MTKGSDIEIMGIVNLTDNSYFTPSRCLGADGEPDLERVTERVGRMLDEGADIIDIGACSTRSGAEAVGAEEEWRRLRPVLDELRRSFAGIELSIDTYHSSVVRRVFDFWGGFIVNDISAGEDDADMLKTVGDRGLRYVAMHKRGTPQTMCGLCDYGGDVTGAVFRYFEEFGSRAAQAGISDWILDPGFGFAKTVEQNYELMAHLDDFARFGRPVLVGVSRKSMIYKKFGITPEEALPQTQVLHFAALQKGSTILRVHDVAEALRTVRIFEELF